jgi:hypothetical protein
MVRQNIITVQGSCSPLGREEAGEGEGNVVQITALKDMTPVTYFLQ